MSAAPRPQLVSPIEPEISVTHYDHIPSGKYPAYARRARVYYDKPFRRWICVVFFDVLDASLTEVIAELAWFLNLGNGAKPHAGRRSNFFRAWVDALGRNPTRNDKIRPAIFTKRHATVAVRDAKTGYSVIQGCVFETGGRL